MQSLSPEQYARLGELAQAWTQRHLKAAKASANFNPRLAADALCFQRHPGGQHDMLVGVLVTPASLALVMLPASPDMPRPDEGERCRIPLPSGEYKFIADHLDDAHWYWRRELLDDLSDIIDRPQASRLAQQLMERVMTPAESS
ncbi:[NiFe]-hydrogenase assembly chaperone HybE [Halomonas urumqiensis]|uniref:[NiFe]-hydrogenase assembly, chaperone, HybE n=1 Tax=Halomonas urumqiensis TaxID=1684789 RepID=A0A2N7UPM6_9GAMM|nr:[NiFe]-hydrogenase assembly chaperone HybE [Halomonas urumqiensis]PMR82394.1 hypothetical protein C1H70_01340 [Halomonas urumqiensis]PTB04126.1 hypothetical protein C6V82_06660 [Halomonas urumqiensis]GHE19606.1 hypothetical protein GCM10017767_01270 [Halomonas urumqiensis]